MKLRSKELKGVGEKVVEMKNMKSRSNILSESLKKKNQNTRTELILKTVIQENSGNKRKPEFTY